MYLLESKNGNKGKYEIKRKGNHRNYKADWVKAQLIKGHAERVNMKAVAESGGMLENSLTSMLFGFKAKLYAFLRKGTLSQG